MDSSNCKLSVLITMLVMIASSPLTCLGSNDSIQDRTGRLIAGNPGADRLIQQAKSLLAQKRYDEAIPILQEAGRYGAPPSVFHFYLGTAYFHKKDLQNAIAEYEAVLAAAPHTPEAMFNMGSCYENLHQYETAITWFEKYLQVKPDASDAADVRKTIDDIKKSMEVHNLFQQSHDLLEQKHPLDARFLLERAAALEPESPEIHYNLGMAYHNSGNLPKAIEEFQHALTLKPNMADAMLNIGSSYQALGQKEDAIGWFQKYLAASPQAPDYKAITDMIASLQKETAKQTVGDDPHGPDFLASVTKQGLVRRWPPEKLPIKVYIDRGYSVDGMRESFPRILVESFDAWMKAAQGKLGYQLVGRKDQADLICDWTSNPGDVTGQGTESEQGVAHVFGKDMGRGAVEISRATIRVLTINKEQGQALPCTDDVMKKTCLHEIGHALGLIGHSPNSHDVMFFSESPTVWPVLSKRDKATLVRLYETYPSTFGPTPLAAPMN